MFQKYISVPKNNEGIYEYDTGVQGSKNLSFYSLPKNEFEFLINNKIFGYLNDKGSLMIDDYESEIVPFDLLKQEIQLWDDLKDKAPTFVKAVKEALTYKTFIGLDF